MSEIIKIIVQPIVQEVKITALPAFAVTPEQIALWNSKQDGLDYTPEDAANKSNDFTLHDNSDELFPTQQAVKTYVDVNLTLGLGTKQNSLGFTPENVLNKDTDGTLSANSDYRYASQKATKTYADTKESPANKDASGGYAGLTFLKINFRNIFNTITSFFTNSNTAQRTYTFQDRDGTIADHIDIGIVRVGGVGVNLDGQGSVLSTGQKGYIRIPYNATITAWSLVADQSGSCVFDIWKSSSGLPTVVNTITASAKPTLSSASNGQSSSLTGWITSVNAGDIIGWNLDSVSAITRAILQLTLQKV